MNTAQKNALKLVLELASENALSIQEARENDLVEEYERQQESLKIVAKLIK